MLRSILQLPWASEGPSAKGSLIEETRFMRDAVTARMGQFSGPSGSLFASPIASLNFAPDTAANPLLAYAAVKAPATKSTPPAAADFISTWALPFGNWGRTAGDGNAATLTRNTGGFIGGIDKTVTAGFGDWWRFGLAGGIQRASLRADERTSSGTIDSYMLSAYASTQRGPLGLRGGAAFGWHDVRTSRSIVFPGFADNAAASYAASTGQVFGELSYGIRYRQVAFEPFVGLAYVNARTRSFTETGGAAALTGANGTTSTTFSTLGLRATAPLPQLADTYAKAALGWRHAFGSVTPSADLAFGSGAVPFVVAGVPIARDAASIEFGVDGTIARDTTIGVSYAGQLSRDAWQHGVNASLVRRF